MQLYVTFTSPYARLARILVIEKRLESRVEVIGAKTRTADSPFYRVNPSGRVPYLVDDAGVGMEDSRVICAYLDSLDGKPRFHAPDRAPDRDWANHRMEASARSLCDGIAVWAREMSRPEGERSQTTLGHEAARTQRMADYFEDAVAQPLLMGPPAMAHLVLAVAIDMARSRRMGDLTASRPRLAAWRERIDQLHSLPATAPPA